MPTADAEQIARITAAQMGGPAPAADPAAAAAAAAAAQPQTPPSSAGNPPTKEEQAQAAASAQTEADGMDADPFIEIDWDDKGKRKLTSKQIKATFERYGALNHEHAGFKPVLQLAKALVEQTGAKPEQVAAYMFEAMKKAQSSNTQMGGDGKPSSRPGQDGGAPATKDDGADPLAAWERDHDVALPPGYRESQQAMQGIQQQMGQLAQMMQAILGMARGASGDADAAQKAAATERSQRVRQSIAHNLDRASEAVGLTEEDAEGFQTYMAEAGYGMEDFVDPDLALRVMKAFAAEKNSPEFERMKQIHQRRQSFTGSLAAAPTGGAGPAAPTAPGAEQFDRLVNTAMQNR